MSRLARFFPIMFLAPVIGMVPPQATASLQLDQGYELWRWSHAV
jgi:hypothetical protein